MLKPNKFCRKYLDLSRINLYYVRKLKGCTNAEYRSCS